MEAPLAPSTLHLSITIIITERSRDLVWAITKSITMVEKSKQF